MIVVIAFACDWMTSELEESRKRIASTFMLFSGYMSGANGPANRMRIYAFDGQRFRSVWMPEDMWGRFDVHVSADRFTVDGDYYRQDRKRHDTYAVSEDGVLLIPPVVR